MKFLKSEWINLVLYGLFGFILADAGVGVTDQPLYFFSLLGILVFTNIRAHSDGLDSGVNIVKEVWGIEK